MKAVQKLTTVPLALTSIGEKVNEIIDANPPLKAGAGINISKSALHTLISIEDQPQNIFYHPFKVYLPDESSPSANILAESRVYTSIGTTSTTITNLTTAFTLASNTYVWLQFTVSSLSVTAISRQTGTAWPSLVVTTGTPATQTQFNVPIGRVTASNPDAPGFEFNLSGTTYHFEQCLFNHLLVMNTASGSVPIVYGFPWSGAA